MSPGRPEMSKWREKAQAHPEPRFQVSAIRNFAKKKKVPEHKHSFWYFFGSIFVHMFSTFFLKAYRPPRELTWITGFLLLVLFLAFGFSGYLLPWNELSFFATRVGTDIAGVIPFVGKALKTFILGGPEVSGATLTRFFWLHGAVGGVVCVFLPWEIGPKADPFASTPLGIKPEWYFTFLFTTLKIVPAHIYRIEGEVLAILSFLLGGLLFLLVPFLDRRAAREKKSPVFTVIGLVIVVYILVMTALTYLAPTQGK